MTSAISETSKSDHSAEKTVSKKSLTIAEMASAYEVSHRTLRFYEDRGLLRPHREGQKRLYGPVEQAQLDRILRGKRLGFTLIEIIEMLEKAPSKTKLIVNKEKVTDQIAYLIARRKQIDDAISELHLQLIKQNIQPRK